MSTKYQRGGLCLLLLSSVVGQVVTARSESKSQNSLRSADSSRFHNTYIYHSDSTEVTTNSTYSTSPSPTTMPIYESQSTQNPLFEISAGKIVILLLLSFSIPVGFMLLLFWRLYKEKKYLSARAGALIYRETVLVPSYGAGNANANGNYSNVVQMHTALYDRPPNYEDAMSLPTVGGHPAVYENQISTETKKDKIDDIPPPSYSAVYM